MTPFGDHVIMSSLLRGIGGDELSLIYILNSHKDRSKADNSLIIVTNGNLKSILLFLHTDYTHSSSTSTTIAINKPYMAPSVAEPLIETSGDNFLEEQPEWRWTGMPITSDPEPGLC